MWVLKLLLILMFIFCWFCAGLVWLLVDAASYKNSYGWTFAIVTWPARTLADLLAKWK